MMFILGCLIVGVISFVLGTFGFCNIIGSLQNVKTREIMMTFVTIGIWIAILAVLVSVILNFFYGFRIMLLIALALSLISALSSGKIQ